MEIQICKFLFVINYFIVPSTFLCVICGLSYSSVKVICFFLLSIVATPGRFLHVMMEMDLKLTAVEYVVFDEADRYSSSEKINLEYKCVDMYTSLYRVSKKSTGTFLTVSIECLPALGKGWKIHVVIALRISHLLVNEVCIT